MEAVVNSDASSGLSYRDLLAVGRECDVEVVCVHGLELLVQAGVLAVLQGHHVDHERQLQCRCFSRCRYQVDEGEIASRHDCLHVVLELRLQEYWVEGLLRWDPDVSVAETDGEPEAVKTIGSRTH